MHKTAIKILISLVSILVVFVLIKMLTPEHVADHEGVIYLIIRSEDDLILFDDELPFYEGDSFYDILDRHFELTCANGSYQADPTCSYVFQGFAFQGRVILGIKNEQFEVMTDWYNLFLAFEYEHNDTYVLASQGPSNLAFEDQARFRISVRNPWE